MERLFLLLIAATVTCTSCQNSDANLKRETARVIGNLTPDQVTVASVERGVTNVEWKAETPKGRYQCSADDMLRRVNCVKR